MIYDLQIGSINSLQINMLLFYYSLQWIIQDCHGHFLFRRIFIKDRENIYEFEYMPSENKSLESLHSWVNPLKTVILLQHTFPIDPNRSILRTSNEQVKNVFPTLTPIACAVTVKWRMLISLSGPLNKSAHQQDIVLACEDGSPIEPLVTDAISQLSDDIACHNGCQAQKTDLCIRLQCLYDNCLLVIWLFKGEGNTEVEVLLC